MTVDHSLWSYFAHASLMVKIVMLILFGASILSWTLIIQRGILLKRTRAAIRAFEEQFWSGIDLSEMYSRLPKQLCETKGMEAIFRSGFKEFARMSQQVGSQSAITLEASQRAMRVAHSRVMDHLERHLQMLATIGSTSPYVGLFGTVWGIMTAFHALGNVEQATIAMVAPGISEALIATAMGLFAAIPAVIAYNRYANDVERVDNQLQTFQEEFAAVLCHQSHVTFNDHSQTQSHAQSQEESK